MERYDLKKFGCFIDSGVLYVVPLDEEKRVSNIRDFTVSARVNGEPIVGVGASRAAAENNFVTALKGAVL